MRGCRTYSRDWICFNDLNAGKKTTTRSRAAFAIKLMALMAVCSVCLWIECSASANRVWCGGGTKGEHVVKEDSLSQACSAALRCHLPYSHLLKKHGDCIAQAFLFSLVFVCASSLLRLFGWVTLYGFKLFLTDGDGHMCVCPKRAVFRSHL